MRHSARSQALTLRLRKPLERALRAGHPWIFRDALEAFEAAPGAAVRVLDRQGRFVASGLADRGPIGVRVFSLEDEAVDEALLVERVAQALALRARLMPEATDAYRLLHGEGDRLPGVVCDRYGATAVLKLDGEAALAHGAQLCEVLRRALPPLGIESLLMRTGRKQERAVELAWGEPPAQEVFVREHDMVLIANLYAGQKTGLFLDHRESRARVRRLSAGASVLNLYGYTGGFSVAAGLGGAERVITVDVAKPALALADKTWRHNRLDPARHTLHAADSLDYLSAAAVRGERHTLVIADPPNFAPRQSAVSGALHAYEALHAAALRVLAPGGYYVAASCSSHVDQAAFEQSLRNGAAAARRVLQVLERSSAPADHPRLLAFPEGDYLKILLCRS